MDWARCQRTEPQLGECPLEVEARKFVGRFSVRLKVVLFQIRMTHALPTCHLHQEGLLIA